MTGRMVLVAGIVLGLAGIARADFIFVKNASNPTPQLDRRGVKDIYIGRNQSWKDGREIELFLNASGTPEIHWVAETIMGATEEIVLSKIKQQVFKGEMKRPALVSSPDECLAAVAKHPGGICIVDAASARSLPKGTAALPYSDR